MTDFSIPCPTCDALVPRMEMHRHARNHALGVRIPVAQPRPNTGITGRSSEQPAPSPASISSSQDAFTRWLLGANKELKYTTIDGQPRIGDPQLNYHKELARKLREEIKQRTKKCVHAFEGLDSKAKETCLEYIQKTVLFPGLVAFTFTHLKVCASNSDSFFVELDSIARLKLHHKEADNVLNAPKYLSTLNGILQKTKPDQRAHRCNEQLIGKSTLLRDDILHFAATVSLSLTEDGLVQISAVQESQAETFIELLDAVIESLDAGNDLECWFRRCLLNALIRITKSCGHYPTSLSLPTGSVNGLEKKTQGGFGCVYKGTFRNRVVALKELRRVYGSSGEFQRDFCKEAIVWRYLRHPNCVPFYGVYEDMYLVSPWMHQGNLLDYLVNPESRPNRISIILDITRGLHYLHSLEPHVAHRDLKPENILISKEGRACLTDFGLATTFDSQAYVKSNEHPNCGTVPYMAPELHSAGTKEDIRKINKRACDIYALGCTIYSIYAGNSPFAGLSAATIAVKVMQGARPRFDNVKIPLDMKRFSEKLWGSTPLERLTAEQALNWMEFKASQDGLDTGCTSLEPEWKWEAATEQSRENGPLYLDVKLFDSTPRGNGLDLVLNTLDRAAYSVHSRMPREIVSIY